MGSLIATWLTQHTSATLILLGRSGRVAKDLSLTVASFGDACVTMARSDVAAAEEAAFTLAAARLNGQALQVQNYPSLPFGLCCLKHCPLSSVKAKNSSHQWRFVRDWSDPEVLRSEAAVLGLPSSRRRAKKGRKDALAAVLQGLLHAGAVLDSGVIGNISAVGVRTEFSGKVHGAWSLMSRAGEAPLRALNFFSSLAAFSGSGGQGSYAAANATLDAWAQALQACTEPIILDYMGSEVTF